MSDPNTGCTTVLDHAGAGSWGFAWGWAGITWTGESGRVQLFGTYVVA
jgi:hypothetical protein